MLLSVDPFARRYLTFGFKKRGDFLNQANEFWRRIMFPSVISFCLISCPLQGIKITAARVMSVIVYVIDFCTFLLNLFPCKWITYSQGIGWTGWGSLQKTSTRYRKLIGSEIWRMLQPTSQTGSEGVPCSLKRLMHDASPLNVPYIKVVITEMTEWVQYKCNVNGT